MVNNTLSVNASYNNQHHIIECTQRNFIIQAADKFKIDDIQNIELYESTKKGRRRIVESDIINLMKVEIVDKKRNGQQRTIDSYTQPNNKFENVILKLRANSPLSGQERINLVAFLQSAAIVPNNKRKLDNDSPEPKRAHKKVQVNIPLTNSKESSTQTEKVILPASAEEATIQEERITDKMKKMIQEPDVNKRKIAKLMADSYDDRRLFIKLKSPPVSNLREKYPSLFELDEVKNELSRIFYSTKPKEFIDNMYKYAPLIIQKCRSDDLLKLTKKYMERSPTNVQKKYAEVVGSVFILTDLMEEQWRFIHLQDYPSGSEDIYPHIDASCHKFKELFCDKQLFNINVEGLKLCDASNFLEAILCLVAAFFIFNIDYPQSCRRTMIMFEKLYLNGNDTEELDDHTSQMVKLLELEAKTLTRK